MLKFEVIEGKEDLATLALLIVIGLTVSVILIRTLILLWRTLPLMFRLFLLRVHRPWYIRWMFRQHRGYDCDDEMMSDVARCYRKIAKRKKIQLFCIHQYMRLQLEKGFERL